MLSLQTQGELARQQGMIDQALWASQEGLTLARELGDDEFIAQALMILHWLMVVQGDQDRVKAIRSELFAIYHAQLTLRRAHGDRQGIAEALSHRGALACAAQDWLSARNDLQEALALFADLRIEIQVASCLEELAVVAAAAHAWPDAARWFSAAHGIRQRFIAPLSPADVARYRTVLAPAYSALGLSEAEAITMSSAPTQPAQLEQIIREAIEFRS
jgi:hypothetical protein